MDWMDSLNKMLSASATFQEFEERFGRLSVFGTSSWRPGATEGLGGFQANNVRVLHPTK